MTPLDHLIILWTLLTIASAIYYTHDALMAVKQGRDDASSSAWLAILAPVTPIIVFTALVTIIAQSRRP